MTELSTAVLATSPDTYLILDESTGPAASDSSGNGHFGTYQGMRLAVIEGVPAGSSVAPSCFPQVVTPPLHGVVLSSGNVDFARMSAMVWFRTHVNSFSASEVVASATRSAIEGWFLQFSSATQQLGWGIGTSSGYVVISDPRGVAAYNNGLWHCAIGTRDSFAATAQLYVDGVLVASATGLSPLSIDTGGGAVGFLSPTGPSQGFTAEPSNFALWQRVITSAEALSMWRGGGAEIATPGNIQPAVQLASSPTGYVLGTPVTGLTGSGTIAVPQLFGAVVTLTTVPPKVGRSWETPARRIPGQGRIMWSDLNGDHAGELIHMSPQLVFSPNRTNLFLRYSFQSGVVATVTPITLP